MSDLGKRTLEILKRFLSVLRSQPAIGVGLTVVLAMLLAGFFLPLPYSPTRPDPLNVLQPPSSLHWFGTDSDGFDVFSRTIAAAARDLPLALIGTFLSALVGVPLGLLASTKGPWSERIMRGLDVFQSFPLVILAIAIVTLMGNRLENVVIAILIVNVPRFMRLVRSEALSLRESRFIEAARAVGATPIRVMRKHMFPNVVGVALAQTSIAAAQAIGIIAALSFLGVGVSPPNPSWGLMIQTGVRSITTGDWWVVVFPGLAVLIAVAAFNLVADGLQMRQENER
ncbi:MAG: ABC transporter permease [Candidatus Nanopelagicales bacterium]|jgi:peptide/nickel transport system permease protein|nr:ABC transporter permease [Candidatus Nanopelagicales bacterium]